MGLQNYEQNERLPFLESLKRSALLAINWALYFYIQPKLMKITVRYNWVRCVDLEMVIVLVDEQGSYAKHLCLIFMEQQS